MQKKKKHKNYVFWRDGKRKRISLSTAKGTHVQHAKKRALERYKIELSSDDYKYLLSLIRNRSAKLLQRINKERSKWRLSFHGIIMYAVYSKKTDRIITFLKPDIERCREKLKIIKVEYGEICKNASNECCKDERDR